MDQVKTAVPWLCYKWHIYFALVNFRSWSLFIIPVLFVILGFRRVQSRLLSNISAIMSPKCGLWEETQGFSPTWFRFFLSGLLCQSFWDYVYRDHCHPSVRGLLDNSHNILIIVFWDRRCLRILMGYFRISGSDINNPYQILNQKWSHHHLKGSHQTAGHPNRCHQLKQGTDQTPVPTEVNTSRMFRAKMSNFIKVFENLTNLLQRKYV